MNPFKTKAPQAVATTEMIGRFVAAWSLRNREKQGGKPIFVMDGTPINDGDLASENGALPLVVWHAENLYRYGIKPTGFGVTFRGDSEALLRRSVSLQKAHRSSSELLCFTLEALEDIRAHLPQSTKVPGATELRTLVNQFAHAMGIQPGVTPAAAAASGAKPQG